MADTGIHLTGKQKRYLRGLGSTIEPVIQVGKAGIVPGIIAQANDSLETRELIKTRVLNNCSEDTGQVAEVLSRETGAALVQIIGHTFLMYRPSTEDPKIELP